jgi:hypothetical protein
MRAVVDDPDLLAIAGHQPGQGPSRGVGDRLLLRDAVGLLLAPSVGLDATALTLLVVQAFGAAAIGRFRSLPMTWVGGLIIGVAASIATKYLTSRSDPQRAPDGAAVHHPVRRAAAGAPARRASRAARVGEHEHSNAPAAAPRSQAPGGAIVVLGVPDRRAVAVSRVT